MSDRASRSFLVSHASPRVLFASGAGLLPAFLFQQDLVLRGLLIVLFLAINAASGRRVRLLQYGLVGAGIVIFNLVMPTGRVLVTLLGLPVTEGALKSGLFKATAMIGLISLSQFSIRSDLRFPGRIGGLLATSLMYFERIIGEKRVIDRKDIIGSLDSILLAVHFAAPESGSARPQVKTTAAGAALLILVVLASWAALGWSYLHPRLFWGW